MRKRFLNILQYTLFLGAGIFLVWWQLKSMNQQEWDDFTRSLKGVNYWVILPVFIMSMLSHLSRAMRWKIILEPLDYKPKLKNVFASLMVGYLANAAVPRLGELLRCTFLARYEKLKVDKLFGSIVLERTFDFLCFLAFIAITLLIQLDLVGGYFSKNLETIASREGMPLWLKAVLVLMVLAGGIFFLRWCRRTFPNNKIVAAVNKFTTGMILGFSAIWKLKRKRAFLLHTLFIWAMYVLQVYVGFNAMQSTSSLGIAAAFSVLTLATLAMIATPGGIGSFPIFVMETLLLYGISDIQGKAFGWLLWGVNTLIFIIAGVTAMLLLPYMNKSKNEVDPTDHR